MTELFNLTIEEAGVLIRERRVTPLELTQACLKRISQVESQVNAFITVMAEQALEQAESLTNEIEDGNWQGPLHGIPVAVKDLIDVAGVPTTGGSSFLKKAAENDASVVRNLRNAGAVIIGKTNLHELALGGTNVNPHFGAAHNPYDRKRITGGSSGGSAAAVSAGMCLGALGTDTGGSVRLPASFCNLTGLRPPLGLVPDAGTLHLSPTLDTIGPITRTAKDAVLMLGGMVGQNFDVVENKSLRVGVVRDSFFWERTNPEAVSLVEQAIETLKSAGFKVTEVELGMPREANRAAAIISIYEPVPYYLDRLQNDPGSFGDDVRALLKRGMQHTEVEYHDALQTGQAWRTHLEEIFSQVDILLTPTVPFTAPLMEGPELQEAARYLLRYLFPFSLSFLPSVSVPCGFTTDGLPVGMQLAGQTVGGVLSVAASYQSTTEHHYTYPQLS